MNGRTATLTMAAAALLLLGACSPEDEGADAPAPEPAAPQEDNTDVGAEDETDAGTDGAMDTGMATATDGAAGTAAPGMGSPMANAMLMDPDGQQMGTVTFAEMEGGIEVMAEVDGLEEGIYGFHVHTVGECEPDSENPDTGETGDFLSAGGHLNPDETDHPGHMGDLPSLLVTADGMAMMTTTSDRLTAEDLMDDDGSAVMIHDTEDNFANVPERYAPDGPDQDTLDTGDAGDRIACGVVEQGGSR